MFTNSTRQTTTQARLMRLIKLITGFFSIILFAMSCTAGQSQQMPPPDFQLVAQVDLSDHAYEEEIVGQFTLAETAVVTLFYTLPNANTTYFDLSLIGPEDDSLMILHSEDYHTDENGGGMWEESLAPGTYQLALTADPSGTVLSVYKGYP